MTLVFSLVLVSREEKRKEFIFMVPKISVQTTVVWETISGLAHWVTTAKLWVHLQEGESVYAIGKKENHVHEWFLIF